MNKNYLSTVNVNNTPLKSLLVAMCCRGNTEKAEFFLKLLQRVFEKTIFAL